jgi:hypothetical protein
VNSNVVKLYRFRKKKQREGEAKQGVIAGDGRFMAGDESRRPW